MTFKCPTSISNLTLQNYFYMRFIEEEVRIFYIQSYKRLKSHLNLLIKKSFCPYTPRKSFPQIISNVLQLFIILKHLMLYENENKSKNYKLN